MKKSVFGEVGMNIFGVILGFGPLLGYLIGSNFADTMEMTSWKWRSFARIILGGILPLLSLIFPTVILLKRKSYDSLLKVWAITLALIATIYPAFNNLKGPYPKKLKIQSAQCSLTGYSVNECQGLVIANLEGKLKVYYDPKSEIAKEILPGKFLNVKMIDKEIVWVEKNISN